MIPRPRASSVFGLSAGSTLGKYEILRKLATGGMAEIYLARVRGTAGFEKLVVLKRILPNVAEDPAFVQMFLDEARLAATLHHPNIADVYDVGEDDGTFFFTMEFIHGQDARTIQLVTRKRGERIPLEVALAIIDGTAAALDYAHEKTGPDGAPLGLVHRDVSSNNVLVSHDGAVKLVDFGIARANSQQHKTQTGTLKGKIPYMSPEQCRGLPIDRRSDLFSLGVLLYELTVGHRPFRGEADFAIMDAIVSHGAKPPTQVVSSYPPQLEAIVMKLLERAPSDRYQTGEQLLGDLHELMARHRLWAPPRVLGKHMRSLFGDRIEAWEAAEKEGVAFVEHVAQTITSESQRSELVTPPSLVTAAPPMVARLAPSHRIAPTPPTAPPPLAMTPPRTRRGLVVAIAVIAVSLCAIAGYAVLGGKKTAPASEARPVVMTPSAPAVTTSQPTPPIERPPDAAPTIEPQPAPIVAAPPPRRPAPVRRNSPPKTTTPPDSKNTDPKKENPWDIDSPVLPQ
jgi:serine/threonine protein kinase